MHFATQIVQLGHARRHAPGWSDSRSPSVAHRCGVHRRGSHRVHQHSQSLLHFWLHFEGASALMAHRHGEDLILKLAEPYASYDMQEYGQTIIAPAQGPDPLASVVGQRLFNAAPLHAFSSPLPRPSRSRPLCVAPGQPRLTAGKDLADCDLSDHVGAGCLRVAQAGTRLTRLHHNQPSESRRIRATTEPDSLVQGLGDAIAVEIVHSVVGGVA